MISSQFSVDSVELNYLLPTAFMVYKDPSPAIEIIGPLKLKYSHPTAKIEAICHICGWATFEWTTPEAHSFLTWHLETTHYNPPQPFVLKASQMPGR